MALDPNELAQIVGAIKEGFKQSGGGSNFQGNGGGGGGTGSRAAKLAGDAVKDGGKALGQALAQGGGKVSDFSETLTKSLGPLGAAFSGIVGYIDHTNSAFQGLSKVGAGFNGDLGRLRMAAADTRMGFDDFGSLIGNNAQMLASFAGGVNGGTKQFQSLSRAMFADGDMINGFLNLGYTVNEANEFLMTNMTLLNRQARRDNMSSEQQVQAALNLASSMDVMAKLTGDSVKEQQDQLMDAQRDGATQAKLRLLEKQGIEGVQEGFNTAYTGLKAGGPMLQKLFQDMTQTGVPMTAATKAFAARNGEAAAIAKRMAAVNKSNLSADEKQARLQALSQQAVAATMKSSDSVQNLTIASLGQVSDFSKLAADSLEKTGPIIDQMNDYAKKQGLVLGETLSYQDAYKNIFKDLKTESDLQKAGGGDGQGAQLAINAATLALAESATKVNLALGDQISTNERVSDLLGQAAKKLEGFVDGAATAAVGALTLVPGSSNTEGAGNINGMPSAVAIREINEKSQAEKEAFVSFFGATNFDGDALKVGIVKIDQDAIALNAKKGLADRGAVGDLPGQSIFGDIWDKVTGQGPTPKALGGGFKIGDFLKVGEQGPETMIAGFDGAVIPNMKQMMNRLPSIIDQLTTGVPTSEASKAVAAQMGMSGQGANDFAALIQQAQTTNELLARLLGVNTAQGRVGEKQLKLARGVGNLMTGLGRA